MVKSFQKIFVELFEIDDFEQYIKFRIYSKNAWPKKSTNQAYNNQNSNEFILFFFLNYMLILLMYVE